MKTRKIKFSNIYLDVYIGILEKEYYIPQPLKIDAEFEINITSEIKDNDITSVLDYRSLYEIFIQECPLSSQKHINLIETLIDRLENRFFNEFPEICSLYLCLGKKNVFPNCDFVFVETFKKINNNY
ncbi:MAG: dihydroneopterin aldolase [Bordetella sp.]|nr:MAG: dihydroneopterin aldolase [Bordetella sp.]